MKQKIDLIESRHFEADYILVFVVILALLSAITVLFWFGDKLAAVVEEVH